MKKYFIPLFFVLLGCGEHSLDDIFGESSSSVGGESSSSVDGNSSSSGGGAYTTGAYLTQTKWNHGSLVPYINKTPVINGELSQMECSATAWAQIIKYHEHPKGILTGIIPEYEVVGGQLIPSVNINGFAFDWQNMTNTYGTNSTDTQKEAVADLFNIWGRATQYGFNGNSRLSGSKSWNLFLTYFDYDLSLERIYRKDYNDNEWISILKQQINQGLPVIYFGQNAAENSTSQHVFIIDGYNDRGQFHVNLGWGGKEDGFYYMDSLPRNYNYNNHATINIKPGKGFIDPKDVKSGQFVDNRNGQEYKTVQIGEQTWMAENLNYNAEGSKCYKDSDDNCAKYGRLYNWKTAMKGAPAVSPKYSINPSKVQGVCPEGWHLPSNREWNTFVNSVGGSSSAGAKLKSTDGWNDNGTDEYGFSALPGGRINNEGKFAFVNTYGYWWSATEADDDANARCRRINSENENVSNVTVEKTWMLSVRCVQDAPPVNPQFYVPSSVSRPQIGGSYVDDVDEAEDYYFNDYVENFDEFEEFEEFEKE